MSTRAKGTAGCAPRRWSTSWSASTRSCVAMSYGGARERPRMTKWCVLCGAEYVAGVLECADCLVPLSDRQPLRLEELGSDDDEQVEYEFDELEPMARLAIDELFWSNGIPHAWADASLVVRADDEDEADRIIDAADRESFLESDAEQVSYEFGDWDDERRAQLTQTLALASIEHAWDEHGELV